MRKTLMIVTGILLSSISAASFAGNKSKMVDMKCWVKVDDGKKAIVLTTLPRSYYKRTADIISGHSMTTSLGGPKRPIHKVLECVQSSDKFKDVNARVEDVAFKR